MALNTVTLKWDLTDLIQAGLSATLSITPTAQLSDTTDHLLIPPVARTMSFFGGTGQLAGIVANDNASILPAGTGYLISVTSASGQVIVPQFQTQLLYANGAAQWLDALAVVPVVTTSYQYLPLSLGAASAAQVPVFNGTGYETVPTTLTAASVAATPVLARAAVQTSNYVASANQVVPVDTTSGSVTVTLPNAPAAGTLVSVKQVTLGTGNTVTLACAGSDVFNKSGGATTGTLALLAQGMLLHYNGSGIWTVLSDDLPLSQLDNRYATLAGPSPLQAQRLTTTSDLSTDVLSASTPPAFTSILAAGPADIIVEPGETYQQFLGVGAALTDSAAYVLTNYMTAMQRTALLTYLFSPSQCGWSMLRVCIGSSDFRSESTGYTYDDMPSGQADTGLVNFSVLKDTAFIIPIVQQILAINPGVRIIAAPWTPPAWMLASGTFEVSGGTFNAAYYSAYAQYFVQFIEAYQSYGIPVWAVTCQNEPTAPTWMTLTASQEETFIGTYLGPALQSAGLSTKILCLDDNWAQGSYADAVLGNSTSAPYAYGVAWHGYGGGPFGMSQVQALYPGTSQIQTEWRSLASESATVQMQGMAGGYVIGGARNFAKGILLWNLCLDQNGNPNQGSAGRLGAVTVNNGTGAVTYNAGFYALTQLSKALQPGAVRCRSNAGGIPYVAYTTYPSTVVCASFLNPDGSVVLYAYNGSGSSQTFQVIDARSGQGFPVTMVSGEVSTFSWGTAKLASPAAASSVPSAPAAPVLTATGGAGQTSLSWTVPSSSAPVDYYVIGRGTSSGGEVTLVQVPAGITSYLDLAGASGTYYYEVTAVSAGGAGTASTEKSVTLTAPAAPAAPVISAASSGVVTLTWTAPVPNGDVITSYNILRGTTSGGETSLGTASQGALSYTDSTGATGTTYYYKVQAVNSAGASASSNEVTGAPGGITLDATATGAGNSAGSTRTWSHTTGSGAHPVLLVWVAYGDSSTPVISSITYGSSSLTKSLTADPQAGNTHDKALDLWYLIGPAAGTATITVTYTGGNTSPFGASASYFNVSQSTPLRTPQPYTSTSGNAPTASTTGGASTDLVLAGLHARVTSAPGSVTPGTGQSIVGSSPALDLYQTSSTNSWLEVTSQAGGTGTITSSFGWTTADYCSEIAVALVNG